MISVGASEEIREAYQRCQRRFPTISLSLEEFIDRAGKSGVPFGQLHHEDLFLATACAGGDRVAWEYFADDYLPLLRRLAGQACRQLQESEDLAQELIASMIEDRSKLGSYDGRGSMASWLRVAVSRAAIDRFRRIRREVSLEETTERGETPAAADRDPREGTEPLDAHWGPILARILATQIERLPSRDRLLLSLYYLNNVPLKSIGCRMGVHEATASRWLAQIRKNLQVSTESELRRAYGLRSRDVSPLWRWVAEEAGFSLTEALK